MGSGRIWKEMSFGFLVIWVGHLLNFVKCIETFNNTLQVFLSN